MQNSIQSFKLRAFTEQVFTLASLLNLLEATQSRMPRLTSLCLEAQRFSREPEFAQLVTRLINNLPLLNHTILPSFQDSSPILSTTSGSSVLRSLTFHLGADISSMNPWSQGETLVSSLEELTIRQTVVNQTVITPLIPLHHLRMLRISFRKGSQLKTFFDALSQHCSALSELDVSYNRQILSLMTLALSSPAKT
jgi:hypothetical protein